MILMQRRYKYIIILKLLGSGSYGDVIKGTVKGTNTKRAIKIIKKSKVKNPEKFKIEIDIMT